MSVDFNWTFFITFLGTSLWGKKYVLVGLWDYLLLSIILSMPHEKRDGISIFFFISNQKKNSDATVQTFLADSQRSVSIISRSCCRTRVEHTDTHTEYMIQNNYIVIKRYACVTFLLIAKGIDFMTHPYERNMHIITFSNFFLYKAWCILWQKVFI